MNEAPIADAGADQRIACNPVQFGPLVCGASVSLDGSFSDDLDDGPNPLSYAWTQLSGPFTAVLTPNNAELAVASAMEKPGAYAFALTVDDGDLSDTDDVVITVNDPPALTVTTNFIWFVDDPLELGLKLQVDGNSDGDALTYLWTVTLPDGATVTLTEANPTFTPTLVGPHDVEVIVLDGLDAVSIFLAFDVPGDGPS